MQPWIEYPNIWKTEAAFMSWLRGGIRRSLWNRHPVKLEFIRKNRKQIPNPNPRGNKPTVWGGVCALTGAVCALKDLEVDHRTGNHSLRSLDDLQGFIEGIVLVRESDLQFVSKEAHKIKSYAEKQGITFEQAQAEKLAISLIKQKKDVTWLKERGIIPGKNQTIRRQQIIKTQEAV